MSERWAARARLRGDAAGVDRLGEGLVVALVLLCVYPGEFEDRSVESVAAAEIGGDGDAIAAARVSARERPPAQRPVGGHAPRDHLLDLRGALPVFELSHVEVATSPVQAFRNMEPAEEDVARRLHQPLPGDDTLAVVREVARAEERFKHGGLRLLDL